VTWDQLEGQSADSNDFPSHLFISYLQPVSAQLKKFFGVYTAMSISQAEPSAIKIKLKNPFIQTINSTGPELQRNKQNKKSTTKSAPRESS
jgi:hypothetical protein